MRYIRTTNSQIEFIEANDEGKILNSIGLQLGEVYFQIKNGKVAFYLNDSEKPFDNFIWSMNLPITIDGEEYEDEDEVSAVLHSIMNDSFQEQLDELREGLAAEEARAQEAEAQLDDKIDDEQTRAIAAENRLQDQVTELSGTVATFDGRITNVENGLSALTDTVNDEITRSTAKDAEHDALISGLTNSLNNEISRATSAETSLHNEILAESNRAQVAESGITANLNTEISRATTRENAIDDKVDAEVTRSTAKDASHDAEISGLTTSLQNEINRAVGAENGLRNDLNAEIANRASGDTLLQSNIDAEEARALAAESALTDALNAEVSRSTAKDSSQDALISGLTTSLNAEISRATGAENGLRTDLNAEISARTADVDAEEARALAAESGITANLNAEIQNRINAVSGLTERVADDEAAFGAALVDLNNKINAVSGENASQNVQISGLTNSINTEISRATSVENAIRSDLTNETSARTAADTAQIERIVALEVGKADKSDLNNYYTKAESDAKYATKDYVSGLTDNFYTKGQTNELLAAKADKTDVIAISGDVIALSTKVDTISGDIITIQEEIDDIDLSDYYTKTESDGKYQLKGDYVTGAQMSAYTYDKQTIDDKIAQGGIFDPTLYYQKSETSGKTEISNALALKQNQLSAGTGIDITSDVISVTGGSQPVDAYTKAESDAKFATITNFNSHSGNTTMHVTASEKSTWNNKSDFSGNYNDLTNKPTIPNYTAGDNIDITNNVISTVTKFWCGTQSQYDAISVKDPNTVYMIHE